MKFLLTLFPRFPFIWGMFLLWIRATRGDRVKLAAKLLSPSKIGPKTGQPILSRKSHLTHCLKHCVVVLCLHAFLFSHALALSSQVQLLSRTGWNLNFLDLVWSAVGNSVFPLVEENKSLTLWSVWHSDLDENKKTLYLNRLAPWNMNIVSPFSKVNSLKSEDK